MPESSREEIAKLEALYANNPGGRVFTHLAEAYRRAGELDRARTILQDGLENHPGYASAYVVFGRVLMDLGDLADAEDAFRRVLELDPHNLVALRSLGDLSRDAGNTDEALRYFEELRQLDPGNDEIEQVIDELTGPHAAAASSFEEPEVPPGSEAGPTAEPTFETAAAATEGDTYVSTAESRPAEVEDERAPPDEAAAPYGDAAAPPDEAAVPPEPLASESPDLSVPRTDQAESQSDYGAAPPPETAPEGDEPLVVGSDFELGWMSATTEPETEQVPADLGEVTSLSAAAEKPDWSDLAPSDEFGDLSSLSAAAEPQFQVEGETMELEGFTLGFSEPAAEETPDISRIDTGGGLIMDASVPESAAGLPPEEGGEMPTETLAELYRKQGLFDRAAEIYQAMLRARPGDPDLQAKLREVELAGQQNVRPVESQPAMEELEPWQTGPFEAETEAPSWARAGSEIVEADTDADAAEPWIVGAGASADSSPTPYAWTEQTPEAHDREGPPISAYFRSLLSWRPSAGREGKEAGTPAEAATAGETTTAAEAFDEWFGVDDAEPDVSVSASPAADQPEPAERRIEEDDDDLEMFRSWLQSLKK